MSEYADIINANFGSCADRLDSMYLSSVAWLMYLDDCLHDNSNPESREAAREILVNLEHLVRDLLRGECAQEK